MHTFIHTNVHIYTVQRQQLCAGSEFQVDGAETQNAREVKLPVMPEGLARRFVLYECKAVDGR